MKKIVLLAFVLVLLSIPVFLGSIRPVEASGTITIKADGSVVPDTAPISSDDNVTYTFTDNINESIVVERDNIVVDGAGYTLQGTGSGIGINMTWRSNVTIKNLEIKAFERGIFLPRASNTSISGNTITNNDWGINLEFSSDNTISGNNITANNMGIGLYSYSSDNSIFGNNITNNYYGIYLYYSSKNTILGNNITNNVYGVEIISSLNNSITENTFVNCGLAVLDSYKSHVQDNLVNGKQLVYLENVSNYTVENAGQVILVNCSRILMENLDLSNTTFGVELLETNNTKIARCNMTNNESGIWFRYSSNNIISGNNLTNNESGIWVEFSSNNTIPGNNITNNYYGVYLTDFTNNNTISGNNITNNERGIYLKDFSNNNTIFGNNLTENNMGIRLDSSSNNAIYGNNVTENNMGIGLYGVGLYTSSNNSISGNNITANNMGIGLYSYSSDNSIFGNNITNNYYGIYLYYSSNNTISGNNITNNEYGIRLYCSSNNMLRDNTMANNRYNFGVYGYSLSDFVNDVDVSNTVDGKPVYLWVNKQDMVAPSDAGYIGLVNCKNITVKDLNLINEGQGVLLAYTTNSTITRNNITNNWHGIELFKSSNNSISGNNITANNYYGIYLYYSSNNTIYHNIVDNTEQVNSWNSINVWDDGYPSGGNYWSDYTDVDQYSGPNQNETGSDKIWDHPYIIDGNNQDNYPFMTRWWWEKTPPATTDDYDGLWHTTDFTINLTATDNLSGVAQTYYKINSGPPRNVTAHGQPIITAESANNTLEYWSVDVAGNEETPHKILTDIKLDKTASSGSITINNDDAYTTSTSVTLTLTYGDATSGVSQVRYSNDGVWDTEPWESPSTTKTWTLTTGDGTKTVYYQVMDNAGLVSDTYSDTILLDTNPPIISITSPSNGTEIRSSSPTITWTGTDATLGLDHYEIRLDDGSWINVGTNTTHTFTGVGDGTHTVEVKAFDKAGYSQAASVNFSVNTSPIGGPGYTEELAIIGAVVVLVALAIAIYLLKIRKKT